MKHKGLLITVILLAVLSLSQMVMAEEELIGVAVMQFKDSQLTHWWGGGWEVGDGLTQLVTDEIAKRGKFRLFERSRMQDILSEKGLVLGDDLDPTTTIELGKLMGVRLMILGTVTAFELRSSGNVGFKGISLGAEKGVCTLTGRVVDAQTGEILGSVKAEETASGAKVSVHSYSGLSFHSEAFASSTLGKASNQAVKSFVNQVVKVVDKVSDKITKVESKPDLEGKVVSMVGSNVVINLGSAKGVKKGAKFQVYRLQNVEGLSAPLKVPVAVIKVIDAQGEASICAVDSSSDTVQKDDVVVLQ